MAKPTVRYCLFNGRYKCPQGFEVTFGNIERYVREDIDKYLDWLASQYSSDPEVYGELRRLREYFVPLWWSFANNIEYCMKKSVWRKLEKDGWTFDYGVVAGCGFGDVVIAEDNDKVCFVPRPCYCHPYSYFWQIFPPEKYKPEFIRLPDTDAICRAMLEKYCKEREKELMFRE